MGDRREIADALERIAMWEPSASDDSGLSVEEKDALFAAARLLRAEPDTSEPIGLHVDTERHPVGLTFTRDIGLPPDTSDELFTEARRLLDAAGPAPWAFSEDSWEVTRDDGNVVVCDVQDAWNETAHLIAAAPRLIAALLERAERAARLDPLRAEERAAFWEVVTERDAERAARERAEAEARQPRELCGYFIDACAEHRISVPFHSSLQGLLADIAAGGAEGAENREHTHTPTQENEHG